jgi:pentatricopeptide repeat protein
MPPQSRLGRLHACQIPATIVSAPLPHFLCPLAFTSLFSAKVRHPGSKRAAPPNRPHFQNEVERVFFSALAQAASGHKKPATTSMRIAKLQSTGHQYPRNAHFSTFRSTSKKGDVGDDTPLRRPDGNIGFARRNGEGDQPGKLKQERLRVAAEGPDVIHIVPPSGRHTDEPASRARNSNEQTATESGQDPKMVNEPHFRANHGKIAGKTSYSPDPENPYVSLTDQLRLIRAVRELEKKLERARSDLHKAMERAARGGQTNNAAASLPSGTPGPEPGPILLTKEDYLNLVDLYFYSHQSRFTPDSPDSSPTPLLLDDYSFKLSADFTQPDQEAPFAEEHEEDSSVLKHVEEMLMSRQLREVSTMQAFVDLLLDDKSSNRALFEVYKKLPDPGVAYLPRGVIRLFLQRMSTPYYKSERSMLRYLSLIDDMQRASLPITSAEWSSAIYLAGRSFVRVTDAEIASAFRLWREMEQEAGVLASHVTFNILFDIAVRAGKFVLGEAVLKEMHARGLRLNRLGRVSLIYYHGLRGDGDAVRKSYRDFVEAGEVVDTLVLNCVMASLIHAQEPIAAEQIYERMKRLQDRLVKGKRPDGGEALFTKYPPPGSNRLGTEMASNSLGRVLLRSARLKTVLPEHHAELQNSMPLRPDLITFRNLISHHASTSGDLDRLTVLVNDMNEQFNLPFTSLMFQILFKGFAIHGGSNSDDAKWTNKRLELVWQACLAAIKQTRSRLSYPEEEEDTGINIPSVADVEIEGRSASARNEDQRENLSIRSSPSQSAWDAFIADFTTVPGDRNRVMAQRSTEGFASPFFPASPLEETNSLCEPDSDDTYSLPSADSTVTPVTSSKSEPSEVRPTKWLVIWLIRAYAHCTGSRLRLEEIWGTIRKVWRPRDFKDRDAAVRALRHALRLCDSRGPR